MEHRQPGRYRVKISATIDPDLLHAVDTFAHEHPESSRSSIIDEALRLWRVREQESAMEAQFLAPQSGQEQEERAEWRKIQNAAAVRVFQRQ